LQDVGGARLAAAGLQNSQIAKELGVTVQTMKFHLTNIYKKLDLANRAEATRWAVKNGLV
jgi:DNA-binding NarL/FixJ family response regulator